MVVAIWLAVVIVVVPLLGWFMWWWNDIWYGLVMPTFRSSNRGTKLPPGYMGLPIIGELFTFLWYFKVVRRPDDYINFKRSKYGDGIGMYRTHLFGNPSVIAFSPTTNKNVFRDDESFVLKWPNVELLGATSMFSVHGDAHLRIRNFVSRSINQPDALRRVALAVQPRMITAIKSWAERREILTYKELKKVTFESIGMYFVSFKSGVKLDRLEKYCDGVNNGFLAFRFNIPGTTFYHAMQCRKNANNILKEELEKRKNNYNHNQDGRSRPIKDLMDGLMNMKDEEGNNLSDTEILDNIVSFLLGGAESTVLATTWAIYYLAKYPKVLQKLRDENMLLKNSKSEQLVTSDEILKLKYTAKVVDETIRLANVAAFVFRRTTKDVKLGEYTIPKGWNIMLWVRYLHTDEGNFDNPMCFNPDRWDTSMPPGTYQPFGGGSRLCAGNMLARLQISTFLYHLSTGYKWELVNPDAKVKYLPNPIPEDNVKITIEKL